MALSETLQLTQARTLRLEVVELLRRAILRGEFKPGDRIVEAEVAAHLGISRGPVREAVRQLEQEGLVTYYPHRGCCVTTLSPGDAWEIYTLRAELEAFAFTLAGGKVSKETLDQMESIAGKLVERAKDDDAAGMVELDLEFHGLICQAGNHQRLYQTWANLDSLIWGLFFTVTNARIVSLMQSAHRHFEVVRALRSGDLELGCRAIREHYLKTGQQLILKKNGLRGRGDTGED